MEDPSSSGSGPKAILFEESENIARPSVVSFSTDRSSAFCPQCREIAALTTIVDAAREFNTDIQDIQFLLSQEEIHAIEYFPGVISPCAVSLANCFERRRTRLLDSYFEIEARRSMDENSG